VRPSFLRNKAAEFVTDVFSGQAIEFVTGTITPTTKSGSRFFRSRFLQIQQKPRQARPPHIGVKGIMAENEQRTPKVLVVDDDPRLRDLLRRYLGENGFSVSVAENGQAMNRIWLRERFDALILDLMMPGEDGLQILRRLRAGKDMTPVIMLTARGEDVDRIVGLELGADDYIAKPFNPRELLARIHAVLRRRPAKDQPGAPSKENIVVRFGDFELDLGRRELRKNGELIALTTGEFAVMKAFARHPKVPLSRDKLMEMARGREYEAFDRSLDVQVSRLRKLIEPDPAKPRYLQTVWGLGYVFIPDDTASGKDGVKPETK